MRLCLVPATILFKLGNKTKYMNTEEIWKPIKGYEGFYEVSNLGRIKSLSRKQKHPSGTYFMNKERIMKLGEVKGYMYITFRLNGKGETKLVHQVVAESFLGHKPDGHNMVVDHINNKKKDNRPENLQIITQRENSSKDSERKYSKYIGVTWSKSSKKWMAQIRKDGKNEYLGLFLSEIDAANAYNEALKNISLPEILE